MNRIVLAFVLLALAVAAAVLPALAYQQPTGVTAEAIGQANLRANPDVASERVGEIVAGTRYPVIGRSEFFPWYLLGDPATFQPIGWVFADLVSVQGNLNQVPLSQVVVMPGATPVAPVITRVDVTPGPDAASPLPVTPATPTLSAPVIGTVLGEINLRYGPGVEFPRIGIGRAGDQFEIITTHTQLPWVEIRYPESPTGTAWVLTELLDVQGNLASLPSTSRSDFNLPSLTPTLSMVRASAPLDATPVPLSPAFQALGDRIWQLMLDAGFETGTSRLGALFLLDLQTGEALTFGNDIAFSGMSLSKIAILTRLYGILNRPPENAEAVTIAESMVCSENISTNELLARVGNGDPFAGARAVTDFLQRLGLQNSFIVAPYANDPFITPAPVSPMITQADQVNAEPDPFNQVTVEDMGGLLSSLYQCAYHESGPLIEKFPGQYTGLECRQILHAMSYNQINALFETGVPPGTRIAHKHGWIDDTHGDAGIVFTPGGDYVLVAIVHNPVWMDYSESFPLIAEISRLVYNYFNPNAPVDAIREGDGAERCQLLGSPLIADLMSSTFVEPAAYPTVGPPP